MLLPQSITLPLNSYCHILCYSLSHFPVYGHVFNTGDHSDNRVIRSTKYAVATTGLTAFSLWVNQKSPAIAETGYHGAKLFSVGFQDYELSDIVVFYLVLPSSLLYNFVDLLNKINITMLEINAITSEMSASFGIIFRPNAATCTMLLVSHTFLSCSALRLQLLFVSISNMPLIIMCRI